MSQHPNADGSITDGVKIEASGKFVSHQIGLAATSVVSLTVPASAIQAVVQADGQNLRITLDGTSPTTTSGFVIPNGTSITLSASDATNAKFISTSTTVGVSISGLLVDYPLGARKRDCSEVDGRLKTFGAVERARTIAHKAVEFARIQATIDSHHGCTAG